MPMQMQVRFVNHVLEQWIDGEWRRVPNIIPKPEVAQSHKLHFEPGDHQAEEDAVDRAFRPSK